MFVKYLVKSTSFRSKAEASEPGEQENSGPSLSSKRGPDPLTFAFIIGLPTL